MKITITGSLGNVGQPLARQLITEGHTITVISSNSEKKKDIEALGAAAAIGSIEDADFISTAFEGSAAVFVMIPPNAVVSDSRAYHQKIGEVYARAIKNNGVKRVVHFSSLGANLEQGTGLVAGSHDVEIILHQLSNVSMTNLRPGFLYSNFYSFIDMIKQTGRIGSNYGGEDKIIMASQKDIASAAAEELTTEGSGTVRYIASDDMTANDAARILGTAIGKPDLQWVTFSEEQTRAGLLQAGLTEYTARMQMEMGNCIHDGSLRGDYDLHQPENMGKIKLSDFGSEFAAAYNQR